MATGNAVGEIQSVVVHPVSGGASGIEVTGDNYATLISNHSPYAQWRFGESSGETAYDEIGSNDGTRAGSTKPTFGATSLISGSSDTAVDNSGSFGERFDVADDTYDGMRSLVFSFKPNITISNTVNTGFHSILNRNIGGGNSLGLQVYIFQGYLYFGYKDSFNSYHWVASNTAGRLWTSGQIYHICIQIDATNGAQIFVDGTRQTDWTDSATAVIINNTGSIACSIAGTMYASQNSLDAVIDELSLFTTDWTDSEVSELSSASEGDVTSDANVSASIANVYVASQDGEASLSAIPDGDAEGEIADVSVKAQEGVGGNSASASGGIDNVAVNAPAITAVGGSPLYFVDGINDSLPDAYWRLGESTGAGTAVDETTNYDGTYVGSPTLEVTGLLVNDPTSDTAVTLNGTSQYITSLYDFSSTGTDDFAIYAIVNLANLSTDNTILAWTANGTALDTTESSITLTVNTPGNIVFAVREDSSTIATLTTTQTLSTAETYNIVATRSSGTLEIWVDGYLDDTTVDASTISVDTVVTSHITTIGCNSESSGSNYLAGTVDEVSIFSKAIIYQEAKLLTDLAYWDTYPLYLRRATIAPALYLRMGGPDTNDSNLYDETGNQNPDHVTLNGTGVTSHAGLSPTGKNKALEFGVASGSTIEFQLDENLYASPEAAPFMASIVYQREGSPTFNTQYLFELGWDATFTRGFSLSVASGGIVVGYERGSSITAGWTVADLNDGNPHHIVTALYGPFESLGNVRLWIDGVDQGLYTGGNKLNTVDIGPGSTGTISCTNGNYDISEAVVDDFLLFETVPPFEPEIQAFASGLYDAWFGIYTPEAEGSIDDVEVNPAEGYAWTNHGFAEGEVDDVNVNPVDGSATGYTDGFAEGEVDDVSVTPIDGSGTVDHTGEGGVDDITVNPVSGAGTVDITGVGEVDDVVVSSAEAIGTIDHTGAGEVDDVAVNSISATGTVDHTGAGTVSDIDVNPVEGVATNSSLANAPRFPEITVNPVTGIGTNSSLAQGTIPNVVVNPVHPNVIPLDHANFYSTISRVLSYNVGIRTRIEESAILNKNHFSDVGVTMLNHENTTMRITQSFKVNEVEL